MEHWEFLLQKEGDLFWLPLESPSTEILEGRYQVLARSNFIDTEISIQISHFFHQNDAPEQQLQAYSRRTNSEGLIVVVPLTNFQPGFWELTCTVNEVSDQQSTWHQSVRLQVLHREDSDAPEDWESMNWPEQTLASSHTPRQKVAAASLHLPDFANQARSLRLRASAGQVFPPQLSKSQPADGVHKSPELPVIPLSKSRSARAGDYRRVEPSHLPIPPSPYPPISLSSDHHHSKSVNLENPPAIPDEQPLLIETAFEALNLKQRFRSALNRFARETETAASQFHQTQCPESEELPVTTAEQLGLIEAQPSISVSPAESASEMVPIPGLVLPEVELVMGQLITVRVTLPQASAPVYVKLWVKDRQTRSLLDGPRWLIEFVLNQSLGVLEASTQLMVPLGSLEMSFEAIALNRQTGRESHKAVVNRAVMPLDSLPVDESNP